MTYPDLLLHMNRGLSDKDGKKLAERFKGLNGIVDAQFNPEKERFLHVWYDPHTLMQEEVLNLATKEGLEARVVGL